MRTVHVKSCTPEAIRKIVVQILTRHSLKTATEFDQMCRQSVNLGAKNTSNMKSRDLAIRQVCDLASMYGVRVELV